MSYFSTCVWTLFAAYLCYTVWSMAQLVYVPQCGGADCLKPYLYAQGANTQVYLYFSRKSQPSAEDDMTLLHHIPSLKVEDDAIEETVHFPVPRSAHALNRSLLLHVFHTSGTARFASWRALANRGGVGYARGELALHHTPPPLPFSLVGENATDGGKEAAAPHTAPSVHLRSVLTLSVASCALTLSKRELPPDLGHKVVPVGKQHYLPILHIDGLAQRTEHLTPLSGLKQANFTLRVVSTSVAKLRLWLQMEASLHKLLELGFSERDTDEVKGLFDTNLYLLCVTFLVSVLHLVFDVLAFKSDISFWRSAGSMAGLSTGSVLWRCLAQAIIFLSLLDDNTSMLVLGPAGVGVLVEAWKVTKALGHRSKPQTSKQTAAVKQTQELDSIAFRYLSYLLVPVLVLGAWYSLLYVPHTSWYSWCITSLVHGVYALGFLFMLPQLFINYKLKSVAHLPWRAFTYKAFNTFIDDLFAFIIKMPTSHRIACFRDDLVFVVYLYQRWLYPVDPRRVNEYGGSGEAKDKEE